MDWYWSGLESMGMSMCWCQQEDNGEATTQIWDLGLPAHPSAARPKLITCAQEAIQYEERRQLHRPNTCLYCSNRPSKLPASSASPKTNRLLRQLHWNQIACFYSSTKVELRKAWSTLWSQKYPTNTEAPQSTAPPELYSERSEALYDHRSALRPPKYRKI